MDDPFITIARYRDAWQAEAACELLNDSDIPAFVRDNHMVSIMPWYSTLVGHVRLEVAQSNREVAEEVLGQLLIDLEAAAKDAPQLAEMAEQMACDHCGGPVTIEQRGLWVSLISVLFLALPLLFLRRKARCQSCGHAWRL